MQLYEMVFALRPKLEEEGIKEIKEEIRGFIGQNGGEVEEYIDIGEKKLAYEVEGEEEGYFIKAYFTINPAHLKDLFTWIKTKDNVIRVIITKAKKKPVTSPQKEERRKTNVGSE